jgi:protein-S-isoprenylcysteine O-methyltransferase Ste14
MSNEAGGKFMSRWVIPIIVLPGTVLVFVPLVIVWLTRNAEFAASVAGPNSAAFWLGMLFGVPGVLFSISAMSMFFRFGEGTAAPWDPPQRLVVAGPYRYVRNPMLAGVIAILIAESLLFQSWPMGIWAAVFAVGNAVYFPLFEEPPLLERFGDDYRVYCQNVPRWIPRPKPWHPPTKN